MGPTKSPNRTSNLSSAWIAHLGSDREIEEFKQLMALSNGPVMKRLLALVEQAKKRAAETALSKVNYESPSWAYIQADNVGYQRALVEIERLLLGIVK